MPGLRSLTPQRLADLARAVPLLARARLRTRRGGLGPELKIDPDTPQKPLTEAQRQVVIRVAWAMAVAGRYVPWRSDCLVQALAARAWLAGRGIESRLVLGMPNRKGDRFEAHAWLVCDDITVTGGNVTDYTAFGRDHAAGRP